MFQDTSSKKKDIFFFFLRQKILRYGKQDNAFELEYEYNII